MHSTVCPSRFACELLIYGIDVITVVPGPVRTAIWDKAETLDFRAYRDTPYAGLIDRFRDLMVRDGRKRYGTASDRRCRVYGLDHDPASLYLHSRGGTSQELDTSFAGCVRQVRRLA